MYIMNYLICGGLVVFGGFLIWMVCQFIRELPNYIRKK